MPYLSMRRVDSIERDKHCVGCVVQNTQNRTILHYLSNTTKLLLTRPDEGVFNCVRNVWFLLVLHRKHLNLTAK